MASVSEMIFIFLLIRYFDVCDDCSCRTNGCSRYSKCGCREVADLLEQNIPNAKKVVIANAGHIMNMEKPAEFNKAVLDFLRKLE